MVFTKIITILALVTYVEVEGHCCFAIRARACALSG